MLSSKAARLLELASANSRQSNRESLADEPARKAKHSIPLSAQPQTSYAQPTSTGGTSQTEVAGWQGRIVAALRRCLGTGCVLNLALQNAEVVQNVLAN